jgi:hypothetical protein
MSDPYATPAKGNPIRLKGSIVGKGIPGYLFSEDMMFQDNTGIMYLDYQAGVPLIGNLIFAWRKVKQLLGKPMEVRGWFFRANLQYVVLDVIEYNSSFVRSYTKFWNIVIGLILFALAAWTAKSRDVFTLFLYIFTAFVFIYLILSLILAKKKKTESKQEELSPDQKVKKISPWTIFLIILGIIGIIIFTLIIF